MSAEETSNYAPRSPDLSSFFSGSPTQAAPHQLQASASHSQSGYKIQPPADHFGAIRADTSSYYVPPPYGAYPQTPVATPTGQPKYEPYLPPSLPQRAQSFEAQGQNAAPPVSYRPDERVFRPSLPPLATPNGPYKSFGSAVLPSSSSSDMPPRKVVAPPPPTPAVEPSPVRTKFPTARIKRIMQADEEVGKVAQQTPIAVGKALELFMIQLVTKSADVAKDKGSKRVTASMLKQVVEADEQWDFLREIVGRVENEKEGSKSKAKAESETDEEMMEEPKKRGRGGRRKKVQ
ncbi:transcriptional regulator family: Histone-like TF [Trichoderma aggressivum f. europaeum]|uniref:NCT transcriptional regulatory complex subunit A n=1 Tax=Trichoderma aggressivum f. europaeum TaxID=173218 RepID=A0AAE1IDH7_9HYPO|nr:transcriptional regulator family: Histone-like TF [Trichoderma aggressivum f. europaeum]